VPLIHLRSCSEITSNLSSRKGGPNSEVILEQLLRTQLAVKLMGVLTMRSVVICGSKRFRREISQFSEELEQAGVVVYRPNIGSPVSEDELMGSVHITRMVFKGLTLEHFDMIRKADVCFIFNKDSYIGASVTLEIGFAHALGRPIYALEATTGDPCCDSLIDAVICSPRQLTAKL
jgi:hypothetical protein